MTTFYSLPNNASTKLISSYTAGAGTFTVADSSAFGTPSPSSPVRITATNAAGIRAHYGCMGVTGNVLNVSIMDGYTDANLPIGTIISCYVSSESMRDIHNAINTLENKYSQGSGAPITTPSDGSIYVDTGSATKMLYIRAAGAWFSTTIS